MSENHYWFILDEIYEGTSYLWPEIILGIGFILILLTSFGKLKQYHTTMAIVCMLAAMAAVLLTPTATTPLFFGMISLLPAETFVKILLLAGAIMAISLNYQSSNNKVAETLAAIMAIVLGLCLLVMSGNFITLYLALEMVSLGSYFIVTGTAESKKTTEAGLKYFIYGAVASAVMLYGMSLLYGYTGTLIFYASTAPIQGSSILFYASLAMLLGGILFKLGAFPLHQWVPDTYQGGTTPVVAFLSMSPKVAAVYIFYKIAHFYIPASFPVVTFISIVAGLSMLAGNWGAISQLSVKRLFGYSSIAQSGFILATFVHNEPSALSAALYYSVVYIAASALFFLLLYYLEIKYNVITITDLNGLGRKYPLIGTGFTISVVSLAGLPPLAGFMAKWLVFSEIWVSYTISGSSFVLVLFVFGLLNALISVFYYLKLPYALFFKKSEHSVQAIPVYFQTAVIFLILLQVALFILPQLALADNYLIIK